MLLSHALKHWLYNELIVFISYQMPCTLCFTWKPIVNFPQGVKLQSAFQNRFFFLNCTATLMSGQGHSPQSE